MYLTLHLISRYYNITHINRKKQHQIEVKPSTRAIKMPWIAVRAIISHVGQRCIEGTH